LEKLFLGAFLKSTLNPAFLDTHKPYIVKKNFASFMASKVIPSAAEADGHAN
jgi:hypothetical protein